MSNKIKSVIFVKTGFSMNIYGSFEDGTKSILFNYFPDELSFTEEEFIGLTKEEAMELFHKKDKEYLRN